MHVIRQSEALQRLGSALRCSQLWFPERVRDALKPEQRWNRSCCTSRSAANSDVSLRSVGGSEAVDFFHRWSVCVSDFRYSRANELLLMLPKIHSLSSRCDIELRNFSKRKLSYCSHLRIDSRRRPDMSTESSVCHNEKIALSRFFLLSKAYSIKPKSDVKVQVEHSCFGFVCDCH